MRIRFRHSFSFLLILFAFGHTANSQGVNEILTQLKATHGWPESVERDSARSIYYNYLAEAYSGNQDSLSLRFIDSLTDLEASSAWTKTEGLLYRAQGKYHDRRGEFESALEAYTRAIHALEKQGDQTELLAYTYILKAFVLNNNGLYGECFATLEKIRPLTEQLANKNYLAWILDCYGDHRFYSAYGNQDFGKALEYYLQVEALLPQVQSMMIKADNAHGLAGCYLRLGDEAKALDYRNKALDIAKTHQLHSVIFAVYGDLADVYEAQGNFDEAVSYRLLGLDYAKQTGWIEMEARAHRTMFSTYKQSGQFEKALVHFEALHLIEDSLARFKVQQSFHDLEAKYELGKKDLEIEKLKAKNLMMYLYILLTLLAGGVLFLMYYRRTNKQLRHQNLELSSKNLEIQQALTEGQNIERKRMAIELHDNINAKIAAAKWMLETINSPDKSQEEQILINRLVDAMSEIYEDVRFIAHNLVPKDLENRSLEAILQQLIDNLNQNQKIKFSFSVRGENPGINTALKMQVYAMIMELIHNTIRHSQCKAAFVRIDYLPDGLNIEVGDDGKGFMPEEIKSGTGLKNLASRVHSVQGLFSVDSPSQRGVLVKISIPLAKRLVDSV